MSDTTLVFIGSSTERRDLANDLQVLLEQDESIRCEVWNQRVVEAGTNALDALLARADDYDFACLVFAEDDTLHIRDQEMAATRDNVVFEFGFMNARLGKERTFALMPKHSSFRIPSDLKGVLFEKYDPKRHQDEGMSALGAVATQITRRIKALGPRRDPLFNLPVTPASIERFYAETGLTDAFRHRRQAYDRMTEDIQNGQKVVMISRVYLSEILKSTNRLTDAIIRAAQRGPVSRSIEITHVSFSADDEDHILRRVWAAEDPDGTDWPTLEDYKRHLGRSDKLYEKLHSELERALSEIPGQMRAKVKLKRRYLRGSFLPYSMLVVDDSIIYVSFYSLSCERYGTYAPTMRLVFDDVGDDTWAREFLQEANELINDRSRLGRSLPAI